MKVVIDSIFSIARTLFTSATNYTIFTFKINMNLFWKECMVFSKSRYKIWVVTVVQPGRKDNQKGARTMVLVAPMVVTN